MRLKLIISFLLFTLLAVYIAFLNPNDIQIYITQSMSLRLPMVVLFLGSILIGVLATTFLTWTLKIKKIFWGIGENIRRRRTEQRYHQVEEWFEKGENAFARGRFEKAKSCFERILKTNPNHTGALFYLGTILRNNRKITQAIELHQKVLNKSPGNLKVLYALSEDYAAAKMNQKEMETLEKIQKIDRKSPVPFARMREVCLKMKDWSSACSAQKRIIPLIQSKEEKEKELHRLSQLIYSNGMRYYHNGNLEAAIPEFKRAIRENPRCLPAYMMLGTIYQKSNHLKNAVKIWKSGHQNTGSPAFLLRIQDASQAGTNAESVIKIYREAIRASKNSEKETLVMMLGALYLEKGRSQEALEELESIHPEDSLLHHLLLSRAQQENGKLPTPGTSQPHFDHARFPILNFHCRECQSSFREWSDHCPVCNTWDSVSCKTLHA